MRIKALTFAIAMGLASPALAIDFSQKVPDGMGGYIKDNKSDVTLGLVSARALFAIFPEEKIGEEEKFRRGVLGTKLAAGGNIDLTVEELVLVKKAIGMAYSPNVIAGAWPLLDPALKGGVVPPAPAPEAKTEAPKP